MAFLGKEILSRMRRKDHENRQYSTFGNKQVGNLRLPLIVALLLLTGGTLLAGWQVTPVPDSFTVALVRRPQHRRPRIPSRSHRFTGHPQAVDSPSSLPVESAS